MNLQSNFFIPLLRALALLFILVFSTYSAQSQIYISEVAAFKGLTDVVGTDSDWIELYNAGNEALNLEGYRLSDDSEEWDKWELPSITIQAGEYLVVLASGKDKAYLANHWGTAIYDNDVWRYFPAYAPPPSNWTTLDFNDIVWESGEGGFGFEDGDDATEIVGANGVYIRKTFNIDSIDDLQYMFLHADYDDGFVAYLNGQEIARSATMEGVVDSYDAFTTGLHEALLYQGLAPEGFLFDELQNVLQEGENLLAVHVLNNNSFSSDLSGRFFLSFSGDEEELPYGAPPAWFSPINTLLHTNFKLSPGEVVMLSDEEGNLLDMVELDPSLSEGLTVGRQGPDFETVCIFDTPSPFASNQGSSCYEGIEPPAQFSISSGWYSSPQTVIVYPSSATQVLRYTTNGDLPSETSPLYASPITLSSSSVLSVRAFSTANKLPSKSADLTFIINEDNHGLPVLSVITDSLNLWGFEEGIYVSGPNASPDYPYFGSNFWQPWSKWSRLHYFDANQELQATAEFDLEIHGGWSRAEPQKSFRFDFKSAYTGSLEYPIFSQKPWIEEVNNINVRSGGQHSIGNKIQDAIFSTITGRTHCHNMAYEPCLVYLNGQYFGVYGMREKIDEQYIEDNFGVSEDHVDLMNSFTVLAGSSSDFDMAHAHLMSIEPTSTSYLQTLESEFNVENYMDYFILQTYIQNLDWMGILWGVNNVKFWRSQQNGKWNYVLYDTDAGFGYFGAEPSTNFVEWAQSPLVASQHSELFQRNLQNETFRCNFANRYADLMNTEFIPTKFNATVDGVSGLINQAMPDHIDYWQLPATYGTWVSLVEGLKDYNAQRLAFARQHVNSTLGFDGLVQISLDVEPAEAGSIQISTIIPDEYPWQGIYFNGCPVSITVIENEGYVFSHWQDNLFIDENNAFDLSLNLNVSSGALFRAHFEQCNPDVEVVVLESDNQLSFDVSGLATYDSLSWFQNGVEVSNEATLNVNQTGIYTLEISDGDCTYLSEAFEFIYLSVPRQEEAAFGLSPNPASDQIRLIPGAFDLSNSIIEIWSVSGRLVHRQAKPTGIISLAHLSPGMYELRILSKGARESVKLLIE